MPVADTSRKTFIKPAVKPDNRRRGNNVPVPAPKSLPPLQVLAPISPAAERALAVNRNLNSRSKPVNRQDQGQARAEGNLQAVAEIKYMREKMAVNDKALALAKAELANKTAAFEQLQKACDIFEKNSAGAAELFEENLSLKRQLEAKDKIIAAVMRMPLTK